MQPAFAIPPVEVGLRAVPLFESLTIRLIKRRDIGNPIEPLLGRINTLKGLRPCVSTSTVLSLKYPYNSWTNVIVICLYLSLGRP
jgi:hypothetical protein